MREIRGLSFEHNKRLRYAIECGYLDGYGEDPRAWRHTFVGTFLWKHPDRVVMINTLKDMLGHEPQWEDMTDENVKDLVDELMEGNRTQSSVRTMCAELRAVLNANKRKVRSEDFNDTLSIKPQATRNVYLTEEEIGRIKEYVPRTDGEEYVQRNFLVCALTGARLVDAVRMTINNCNIETGMLSYIPKKTPGIVVNVPVDERRGLRVLLSKRRLTPVILPSYNRLIRDICKRVGIGESSQATRNGQEVTRPKWQLVSSHTARRSFATNLYLAGVSIEDIALMMGHGKNIETTKRYLCAERQLMPSVMAYFQPQSLKEDDS